MTLFYKKNRTRKLYLLVIISLIYGNMIQTNYLKKVTAKESKHNYIISTNMIDSMKKVEKIIDDEIVTISGKTNETFLKETGVIAARLTSSEANDLEKMSGVSVEKDYYVWANQAENKEANFSDTNKQIQNVIKSEWNLKVSNIRKMKKVNKNKIKTAILDSGVEITSDIDIVKRVDLSGSKNTFSLCEDMTGHGTRTAGIMVAKDNNIGTTGVDENIPLYSIKVFDEDNRATISSIIEGLKWCIHHDIKVVNMSFGTRTNSKILHQVIKEAERKDMLLIAAAGNGGTEEVEYPAAYKEVIGVGSIDSQGRKSGFSATGEGIDLMAPGENIPVTGFLGLSTIDSGTSFAAPHVSAIAASLWNEHPDWSAYKIRAWLVAGALKMDEEGTGYGIIDYTYTKKIERMFDINYIEDKPIDNFIPKNSGKINQFKLPSVTASWNKNGHEHMIEYASNQVSSAYTTKKLVTLKK